MDPALSLPERLLKALRSGLASTGQSLLRHRRKLALSLLVIVPAVLLGLWLALVWDLPGPDRIRRLAAESSLTLKARDGSLLSNGRRGPTHQVTARQLPRYLKQAVVATEDRRFYAHQGIDPAGILRAMVRNTEAGEVREGGSTITQQLARTLFLTQERTLWRKLKEIAIAYRLEQDFSKDEILALYLNQVYFGSGAYGAADAARTYFDKPVEKLNLGECALLAGLPQAPSRYSPLVNKSLARKRRDVVLSDMRSVGFLNVKQYEAARRLPVVVDPGSYRATTQAAYFTDYVQALLPDLIGSSLLPDGLTVETTLDLAMQVQALRALNASLVANRGRRISQGALVALDPTTGQILAMVGGSDYRRSQFNRAVQAMRQPGSTFKAFVYTAAIESGLRPDSVFADAPTRIGTYEVKNYDRRYHGSMTLTEALKASRNTIAVQLFERVGEPKVIDVARRMGIHSALSGGAPMALGASVVNLLELTSAYGTLANNGVHVEPTAIRRVLDRSGQVLFTATAGTSSALTPEIASTMTAMLRQVIADGTGRRAAIDRPAAGKTGTTEENRDLLFVGYTPQIAAGVWLGNDDNSPTRGSSGIAAATWATFMRRATAKLPPMEFLTPPAFAPPPEAQQPLVPEGETSAPVAEPSAPESPPGEPITCETDPQGNLTCRDDTTGNFVTNDPDLDADNRSSQSRERSGGSRRRGRARLPDPDAQAPLDDVSDEAPQVEAPQQ